MKKAELFFDDGQIDSSLHYIELCYKIEKDYPPAHHLEGKVYLDRDGIYNRRLSAESLKKAVKLEDDNPEYHYSLGQTFERQGYFNNALREYHAAARLDSADYRPLERISEINKRIGLRYDDKKYFKRSLKASSAAAAITDDPQNYYRQGIALYQMGDYESSIVILKKGIDLCVEPSDARDLLLLLGTDLVRMAKFDSALAVFETARAGMTEFAYSRLEDLRYLMSSNEYKKFESESNYNQGRIKKQYWGSVDPNPTTDVNERKLEHFSRYVHALLTFSVPDKSIEGWRTKRGEMYIRYGRPTSMNFALGSGDVDSPKWVWRYAQFPQPISLIFEDTFLNGDFDFPYPNKDWTAADYDRDSARLADMLQSTIPQTFAYNPGSGPLEYFYMPKQFKGGRGKTAVEVFVTVPYPQLTYNRDGEHAIAEVEWRQVLRYGSWKSADSSGTKRTYRIRASQVDNPNLSVADRLALKAYPDSLLFSISIRDTLSNHIGIDSRAMRLRDFYTGKVEISDMVLARRIDSPPDFEKHDRGDLMILSNLDNRYFVGESIWLYFEIYNLKKDSLERTSYTLKQTVREKASKGLLAGIRGVIGKDKLKETSISYKGSGVYTDENRILTIDVSELEPGDYAISIEITDEISGKKASVREDIVLYR
ncbi:MAG: GWxTD domain-containing protein [candidate division Zixibacteria bacterium]